MPITETDEASSGSSEHLAGCAEPAAAVAGERREAPTGEQEEDGAGGETGEEHLPHGGQDT